VIDHYDRAALDGYLREVGSPMLDALGAKLPHAIFADSMEVFGSDWTPEFAQEFQKRRGYDLIPLLPSLTGDVDTKSEAVRQDWGRTLTELFDERFMAPMQRFAKERGTKFRVQGYGIPPATISSNASADISEGEGVDLKEVRAARWAASANHIFGHPVTTSETWTWLHSPSFRATPLDMKAEADIHFCKGESVDWAWLAVYAGWRGLSGVAVLCSGGVQREEPVVDCDAGSGEVLAAGEFHDAAGQGGERCGSVSAERRCLGAFRAGRVHMIETQRALLGKAVMAQILEAGYGLDFFDDGAMATAGKIAAGKLSMAGIRMAWWCCRG